MSRYLPPPSNLPTGSIVWAYLRDSGGPSQGESIERQRSEIEGYCTSHGLILQHVYFDEARSGGSTTDRDQFDSLISASGKPDHAAGLLLWDYARLARNLDDSGYYKALLRKNGLIVHSLTDAIPEGPYSRVVEVIIDIANEEKRRQVSRDTASGLRRIVEEYGAMPGAVPTGYKGEPVEVGKRRDGTPHILHRWVPDPEKAPIVLLAFKMRAQGKTFGQIRKATGLFQSTSSYGTFFNNRVYKGEYLFGDKIFPVQAIVPVDVWDKVQELGELRGRSRYQMHHPRRINSPYILSGLIFCQECGSPMNGYVVVGRKYYLCNRAHRRRDCSGRSVPARKLEDAIINRLLEDLLTVDNLLKIQASIAKERKKFIQMHDQERTIVRQGITKIKKKIDHFTAAIGEGGPTRALMDSLQLAEQERDRLELELKRMDDLNSIEQLPAPKMAELADTLTQALKGDHLEERRQAVRSVINRILVRRTDTEVKVVIEYHPPKETSPDGEVSASVSGPDGVRTRDLGLDRAAC